MKRGGCIVIKDNITSDDSKVFDTEDYSWTRPKQDFYSIFEKAKAEVLVERKQFHFPKGIYEVRMFALKPAATIECDYSLSSDDDYDFNVYDETEDKNCTQVQSANINVLNEVSKNLKNVKI